MRFLRTSLTLVAAWCAFAPTAFAQDSDAAPPPHISRSSTGTATLDREDVTEPATGGAPLVPGDRLRTERGRAELLFPDGSAIDLDEYSTIELEGPTLLRMTSGRVLLFAAGSNNPASAVQFQIDTPVASAQTDGPGEYRVSILGGPSAVQTEMAVVRGGGALVTELGTMPLRSGERSIAWDNAAPSRPQIFNSARYDAFDQWAMALRDQRLGSRSQSAQYLPADLRMYGGDLDRYGAWSYEAPYGNVWYPTVAPEWRPYYDGYWSSVPLYGWTWIGVDTWSWPTHHYGRWGYARSRWFWIPDRRWSPAWVSWGGAPGYVSWCPLGFDNRPVFSLSVSAGGGYRGWTVLSRDHFGGHRSVRQFAVAPRVIARQRRVRRASVGARGAATRGSATRCRQRRTVRRESASVPERRRPNRRRTSTDGGSSRSSERRSAGRGTSHSTRSSHVDHAIAASGQPSTADERTDPNERTAPQRQPRSRAVSRPGGSAIAAPSRAHLRKLRARADARQHHTRRRRAHDGQSTQSGQSTRRTVDAGRTVNTSGDQQSNEGTRGPPGRDNPTA